MRKIAFGPAKAANAGGVGVGGLEQSQNACVLPGRRMRLINAYKTSCANSPKMRYGQQGDSVDYVTERMSQAFVKVADAMLQYGIV